VKTFYHSPAADPLLPAREWQVLRKAAIGSFGRVGPITDIRLMNKNFGNQILVHIFNNNRHALIDVGLLPGINCLAGDYDLVPMQ
jgi:hypothetical protein